MRRIVLALAAAAMVAPLSVAGSALAQDRTYQSRIDHDRAYHQRQGRPHVHIAVDKAAQRMTVTVDGRLRHRWPVSTGRDGGPPSGTFRPERLERYWRSRKYDWTPMPHSIFFYKGYAIHGTTQVSRLGNRASRGCVRLHPAHAATLFALVRDAGMNRTTIVVSESRVYAGRP
jgi:lipoprotein-anchoring transpeptidase ErfK/SrfK